MFRLLFLMFFSLRVIACPVICALGVEHCSLPHDVIPSACADCCSHCGSESQTDHDQQPCEDDSCPCKFDCVCQITVESNQPYPFSLDALTDVYYLIVETDSVQPTTSRGEGSLTNCHPATGRFVRISHCSLLL